MTIERHIAAVGTAMLGLVACDRNSTDQTQTTGALVRTTTTTASQAGGITIDPNDAVIERLTTARCNRELACNNVGTGKHWSDEAACRREVRQNTHADMRQSECHFVITDKVQSCVDALKNEKCNNIIDPFGGLGACRQGNLCKQ